VPRRPARPRRRRPPTVARIAALSLALVALAGCGATDDPTATDAGPTGTPSVARTVTGPSTTGGVAATRTTIRLSALPPEARTTLDLIDRGGPFPHRQDGTTFQNRERLLPARPVGTYREYTVRTPGARTRGARRLVVDRGGPRYYTADHYRSFRRVVP